MVMEQFFSDIRSSLINTLEKRQKQLFAVYDKAFPAMGKDTLERLFEYTKRGKMLRGCLVSLGLELFAGSTEEQRQAALLAGAALELFQSGLLIHDDIMDRDRLRRGKPTLHAAYEDELSRAGYAEPEHYGQALAICAGDLAFFSAFELLAEVPLNAGLQRKLVSTAARELSLVGIAQMRDVANGALQSTSGPIASFDHRPAKQNKKPGSEPDEEAILALYRHKTARYTFSLPLTLGLVIASASDVQRSQIEQLGEKLGLIFQLKDDELGLFADEKNLGKPVGTDIRENKRTLHRLFLFEKAEPELRSRLEAIFGSKKLSIEDLAIVRNSLEGLGIRRQLADKMHELAGEARHLASPFMAKATAAAKGALNWLIAYSLSREF